jgi:SAM-dependent methyltransferase
LYLTQKTDFLDNRPKKMLHIAPMTQLTRLFQSQPHIDYLSADLEHPNAMVKMDITKIEYSDNVFDVIYCSHVLEHVDDDRKAMRELYRVLKPGGWAILQVPFPETTLHIEEPIEDELTFEDPTIISDEERLRHYGQVDHVRRYGSDYQDRLKDAGFIVKADEFVRELNSRTVQRLGLMLTEDIYLCRKQN